MMSEHIDLDAIIAHADAATPGPWVAITTGAQHGDHWYVAADGAAVAATRSDDVGGAGRRQADAEFIAEAREWVPALVAEVKRLRTRLDLRTDPEVTR